jgi:hypothetical protein
VLLLLRGKSFGGFVKKVIYFYSSAQTIFLFAKLWLLFGQILAGCSCSKNCSTYNYLAIYSQIDFLKQYLSPQFQQF